MPITLDFATGVVFTLFAVAAVVIWRINASIYSTVGAFRADLNCISKRIDKLSKTIDDRLALSNLGIDTPDNDLDAWRCDTRKLETEAMLRDKSSARGLRAG